MKVADQLRGALTDPDARIDARDLDLSQDSDRQLGEGVR
ncbi:hypothetical protein QFZ74_005270 [Streptomyces sp. V3I7]|nr:hypothetical protein [Streptomyces sp. V3I7]